VSEQGEKFEFATASDDFLTQGWQFGYVRWAKVVRCLNQLLHLLRKVAKYF